MDNKNVLLQEKHNMFYSNNTGVITSNIDIQILFKQLTIDVKNNIQIEAQSITVMMSPQQAKRLSKILQENINQFEKMNGEIKIV